MARVILDARQACDHRRHARQGPQIGTESVGGRPAAQGRIEARQLLRVQPRLPARPPGRFQAYPAVGLPGAIPPTGRHRRHIQHAGHSRLRFAAREQPRGLEPSCFQRGEIPSGTTRSRHGSTWHRSA